MLEFNPQVLRRVWALRQFPMFASADLGDLALVAENVVEAEFAPGQLVSAHGARPNAIQLVVSGELASHGSRARRWSAREVFGLLEVLARQALAEPVLATCATHTLQLSAPDLGEILEEGFGVLRATLHELSARLAARGRARAGAISIPDRDPLGLVDRLLVLRQLPPFTAARLDTLAALAHACEEAVYPAGAVLARAGDPAASSFVIADGQIRATRPAAEPELHGPGAALGGVEAVGELLHTATLEAVTPVRVLACKTTALFDVIEDHAELGLAMLSRLASGLLAD